MVAYQISSQEKEDKLKKGDTMLNKKSLKDLQVQGKKVLVRCDFNVPMDEDKNITDDRRITSSLPTIEYLVENGARVILMSHLGRPKGEAKPEFSLEPVGKRLSELLKKDVVFAQDNQVVSEKVKDIVKQMEDGDVALLENTRFRKEEEENEEGFAKDLASLGDLYVNDAFGTSHRSHASNVGLSRELPSAVGYLVEKELTIMGKALEEPERPFVAILGGAKVSDKIGVIENLIKTVDTILIGGGMAYTFLKAQGYEIGTSIKEEDKLDLANELLRKAEEKQVKILLPVDIVVAKEFKNDTEFKTVKYDSIPADMMGMDMGEETVKLFSEEIKKAKTVVWNGPMGVFEMENFKLGTEAVGQAMANSGAITIVGGGDSASAIEKAGLGEKMTHISTGGGASLMLLEGKELPGVGAIEDR